MLWMNKLAGALVLGPSGGLRDRLIDRCRVEGWQADPVSTRKEMTERLGREDVRCIFIPSGGGGDEGLNLLTDLRAEYPDVVVVVYTSAHEVHPVVEAITRGAFDALEAPFHADEIRDVLRRVEELSELPVEAAGEYDLHIEQARRGLRFRRLSAAHEHIRRALEIDPGRPASISAAASPPTRRHAP